MIECFFDCSSPWTYLAFHNLQPLAAQLGERGAVAAHPGGRGVQRRQPQRLCAAARQPGAGQARLHAEGPAGLGPAGGPGHRVPAARVPGQQRQGHARLHLAGRSATPPACWPLPARCSRAYWSREEDISQDTVLAPLCEHVGRGAGRILRRHRPERHQGPSCAPTPRSWCAAAASARPPCSSATTCTSATTGWNCCARAVLSARR